jgi:plastocyanin domain-containing protein
VTLLEVVVAVLGAALVIGELWVFLGPQVRTERASSDRVQEVKVLVGDGFEPDVIPVEVGRPVRLLFYRGTAPSGPGQVIFDRPGISQPLEPDGDTVVEFIPSEPGDYPFRSGEGIMGLLVAQVGADAARANLGRGHQKHG